MKTRAIWKIGIWNVRRLYQTGKADNLVIEMKRLGIDILSYREVW